ncbi:MAG: hypothetical protein QHC67_13170 [Sphingobium sp.]|uniref:hypothetical protein n=1 Tax=Sphingobium sp. TaxID=1912891 RepID=UPI0029A2A515|nr:hypothetical protein [Sphingobium sp.]MDX3910751.1 hypothetical protein [Sphingobium sp.]
MPADRLRINRSTIKRRERKNSAKAPYPMFFPLAFAGVAATVSAMHKDLLNAAGGAAI